MPFDAAEMIRETKAYPLLKGIRGQTPCDIQALEQLLLAVSRLVMEHREIKELDLNPVRVLKKGCWYWTPEWVFVEWVWFNSARLASCLKINCTNN